MIMKMMMMMMMMMMMIRRVWVRLITIMTTTMITMIISKAQIEGFRPEWRISTIYHGRDMPLWSETLKINH